MLVKAYAKINFGLAVTGADEVYHMLDSVMDSISIYDDIEIKRGGKGVRINNIDCVDDPKSNIAYRAANMMIDNCGITDGVSIDIEKKIPSGAGLGGGSADAAAVLHAMNALFSCELPDESLAEMGLQIGSDVPYCVLRGRRRAKGRGEKLGSEIGGGKYHVVTVKGNARADTAKVFTLYDIGKLFGGASIVDIDPIERALFANDIDALARLLPGSNDLFEAASVLCSDLAETKRKLDEAGALCSWMTGSGSVMIGLFADRESAKLANKSLPNSMFHEFAETFTREECLS